jgi:hypothetical protein
MAHLYRFSFDDFRRFAALINGAIVSLNPVPGPEAKEIWLGTDTAKCGRFAE